MDNISYWIDNTKLKNFDTLNEDLECDVCVIGGGITGVSTAYKLAKQGLNVVILEREKLASKTTGFTTAKITSQHGLFYDYLINFKGIEYAKEYLEANEQAISDIKNIIDEENIDCDFEIQSNYVYTGDESEVPKFEKEIKSLQKLNFSAKYIKESPLPIKFLAGIEFPNQAQFNPRKYISGLCDSIIKNNGKIFENSKVYDVEKFEDGYITLTKNNKVKSKYVVLACHYPFINTPGFYFLKMYQSTSYAIVADTKSKLFSGMYINTENPTLSFKTIKHGDKRLLLIGGNDHKTGQNIELKDRYEILEATTKNLYPDSEILYRWSTEDCISLDKIPYIGEFSKLMPNMYVATGYKKWGMTTSNIASNIIADKILGKENPYEDIFTATRLEPIKNRDELGNMIKQSVNSLIINKFKIPEEALETVENDSGKIIEIDGKNVGVYRNKEGKIYAVKPVCTHLGCLLKFNDLEKTWDCPCHGSRFDYEGNSIYAPSIKNLEKIEL